MKHSGEACCRWRRSSSARSPSFGVATVALVDGLPLAILVVILTLRAGIAAL